jgi:hypothetical protein
MTRATTPRTKITQPIPIPFPSPIFSPFFFVPKPSLLPVLAMKAIQQKLKYEYVGPEFKGKEVPIEIPSVSYSGKFGDLSGSPLNKFSIYFFVFPSLPLHIAKNAKYNPDWL